MRSAISRTLILNLTLGMAPGMALAALPETSFAQESRAGPAADAHLQRKSINGAAVVCGGIGQEEAAAMRQDAPNHDVALTFVDERGEYLADVNIALHDAASGDAVLETTCSGPMMLIDLPRGGRYRLYAETGGKVVEKPLSVSKETGRGQPSSVLVLTSPTGTGAPLAPGATGGAPAADGARR